MRTAKIQYAQQNPKTKTKMNVNPANIIIFFMAWIAGNFTFLKINLGDVWDVALAVLVAGLTGFAAPLGKYLFDKKLRPKLDKWFRRKKG